LEVVTTDCFKVWTWRDVHYKINLHKDKNKPL